MEPALPTTSNEIVDHLLDRRDQVVERALAGISLRSLALEEDALIAGSDAPARILERRRS
jgi:hypothetical protein